MNRFYYYVAAGILGASLVASAAWNAAQAQVEMPKGLVDIKAVLVTVACPASRRGMTLAVDPADPTVYQAFQAWADGKLPLEALLEFLGGNEFYTNTNNVQGVSGWLAECEAAQPSA